MTGKIFVNYRRGDDAGFTQALYQRLEEEFTAAALFMDVEGHIKPGDDFVEVLTAQVAAAEVLLVVIGPRWAELLAARAGDPDDFVAIEILAGLDGGKRVIPVLVGGASMPRADALHESIRALARRNAVGLRPERFRADCQGLVTSLKEQLAAAALERSARTEAERAAAEDKRLKREAEEAARIAAAEERERAQRVAGIGPEEIRKSEEFSNWDFIKDGGDPQKLRDHLARFPAGITATYALTTLEEATWALLAASSDASKLQAFLEEFPNAATAELASSRLAALRELEATASSAQEKNARASADGTTAVSDRFQGATTPPSWIGLAVIGFVTLAGITYFVAFHDTKQPYPSPVSQPVAGVSPAVRSSYPERPIQIIVPFAAGGNADVIARALSDSIEANLGHAVLVVNMAGASGAAAASNFRQANPDGYTLLLSLSSADGLKGLRADPVATIGIGKNNVVYAIVAPSGTAEPIVKRLKSVINNALTDSAQLKSALANAGVTSPSP